MGTRSLTHIKDENDRTLVTVYRHYDGYPEGHGIEMAEFLVNITIGNGIPFGQDLSKFANGMGCLAAQFIAEFKDGAGNIYIQTPNAKDCWEEYTYRIKYDKERGILMNYNGGKYWTPKEFIEKFKP